KEIVKSDHPARFEEALTFTAKVMSDSKAFVRAHDLATIPPNEDLTVIETPSYLRHVIPFAAYNAPARFEAHKQGFYMVTPVDQSWRACRILIDVDLHSGKMTFDEAVDVLVREAGMERPGAVAEVKRYTYNPAYQLSYLIGKYLIVQLRKDVKKRLGKSYSDKLFHDTILYSGSLPMTYMREIFEHKVKELVKLKKVGL